MKELIKKNSKLAGALLGLLQGLPQGLGMESNDVFSKYNQDTLIIVVAFGLFAPPVFALFNSASKQAFGAGFIRSINEYTNLYFMMIVGSLSLGISGWLTLHENSKNDGTIISCAFFIAGGIGFLIAYFIDGQFGRRAEKNA